MAKRVSMLMTSSKPRNSVARDLRTPKYRQRIVRSAKDFKRNDKHRKQFYE